MWKICSGIWSRRSRSRRRGKPPRREGSTSRNIYPIVIRVAVNELVVGIDTGPGGRLVNDNLEGLGRLGEPRLLEVEGFFFVLLAAEDADVDEVAEGH